MTKYTPPNAGQIAKIEKCLDNLLRASTELEHWLRSSVSDLPNTSFFHVRFSSMPMDFHIELTDSSQGFDAKELSAERLIGHIERHGAITAAELREYEL